MKQNLFALVLSTFTFFDAQAYDKLQCHSVKNQEYKLTFKHDIQNHNSILVDIEKDGTLSSFKGILTQFSLNRVGDQHSKYTLQNLEGGLEAYLGLTISSFCHRASCEDPGLMFFIDFIYGKETTKFFCLD